MVLVVDDSANNRQAAAAILSPPYRVLEAASGDAALLVLEEREVDLVLLDVMMPRVGGLEVCRRIKSAARDDYLPVVLLTALTDQADRNAGLMAGADDFLTKPLNREELLLRVQAFLTLRRQDGLIRRQLAELQQIQAIKDDLVAMMVHDIRNPLTGLMGSLSVLQEELNETISETHRQDFDHALVAAQRISLVLNNVLEVRTLEEGKLPLRVVDTELQEVASAALASVAGDARVRGVELRRNLREARIRADRDLVQRALENVLANALKFSSSGSVVELSMQQEGQRVAVAVADRGPGVPDRLKDSIFEKFETHAVREMQSRMGFGLGLHLVKLVMASHQGTAVVRDRDGGGSVFELVFPVDA